MPLGTGVVGLHPLSWEQPSLGLVMSFLTGIRPRPSPDQSDPLAPCLVPDGVRDRTLQVWAKGLKHPITCSQKARLIFTSWWLILNSAFLGARHFSNQIFRIVGATLCYTLCAQ